MLLHGSPEVEENLVVGQTSPHIPQENPSGLACDDATKRGEKKSKVLFWDFLA
jgi:hypothetical protein